MTEQEIRTSVLEILTEICDNEIVTEDLDINLDEEDLIDSIGYTELLLYFEEELNIIISPSEYTRDEFNTPAKILAVIMEKSMLS